MRFGGFESFWLNFGGGVELKLNSKVVLNLGFEYTILRNQYLQDYVIFSFKGNLFPYYLNLKKRFAYLPVYLQ